ncbi:GTP-binding protein [Candidatus Marsarchaeota archaeon]|nr:GTP-binding protein [Candidatus Marsarchaeota archaeon]
MKISEVTLLGHKDHGKSTLIGNLLIATGSVSEARINDAKRTSKQLGRKFEPGFILDSFQEEREGGLTIDTTRAQILYNGKAFELIDVPGHEELIKNMMSGASNADFAVLTVSAKNGEGIKDQTFRHLYLAKMLGIRKIIVAVNKMDEIRYDKKKFDDIRSNIRKFLMKIGIQEGNIKFVPISAYNAENLLKKSSKMAWYSGNTLLDLMSKESNAVRKTEDKNLRILIQGYLESSDGRLILGKVISGKVKEGEFVSVLPQNIKSKIIKMYIKGRRSKSSSMGQNVALKLNATIPSGLRGSIIYTIPNSCKPTKAIQALIFSVKDVRARQTLRFNGNSLDCNINVEKVIDTTTGDIVNKPLKPLNAAIATIGLAEPIMAEPFSKSEDLGRFVLYYKKEFSGIGIIL